jgi:choline-sulfatase
MRGPLRFVFALAGASAGAALMALVEGRALLGDTDAPPARELFLDLMGVSAPIAVLSALVAFAVAMFFEPARTKAPTEYAADLRALPVLLRSRLAALLPLLVLAALLSLVASAHLARDLLSEGAPRAAGAALALSVLGVFAGFGVLAVSLSSPLRKLLAHAGGKAGLLIDPVFTLSVGTFLAALLFALGVGLGDSSGVGPTPLAILGVLARKELDLSPVTHVLGVLAFAYVGLVVDGRVRRWSALLFLPLLAAGLVLPLLAVRAAHALNEHEKVTREMERRAPAGRIGLRILRKLTDRDKDGRSALFGGLDCDDRDPRRSPDFFDKPGNDIDEDCSGADTPAAVKLVPKITEPELPAKHYNVILITVDTLRADVGFLGYPQPVTPNLDRLAEKSTVYEHAYAMASYTGKSIGPMLIGKYPSETSRDGSHFNAYDKNNVFVTTRLRDAGIHTFGCSGHWYWKPWSGVTQGMDLFDLSPIPPGMTDNDNSVGGDRVSDAAIRMLKDEAHSGKPFFMWIHYFDPHAQYVPHPGAPTFLSEKPGPAEYTRAAYDGEVWFTDQQVGRVLDYVQNAPIAKDTAIIVTADHGEALGEHNMSWHGAELWEMLVHVPLLVYVPDAPPRRDAPPRSHIDLVPTILDLEAVKKPTDGSLDGVSLLADVRLAKDATPKERDVYMDMPAGPWNVHRRALITGKSPGMKLIHLGGPQYQLFDLAADPGEKNDLSSDKERVKELADRMTELRSHLTEIDVKPDTP